MRQVALTPKGIKKLLKSYTPLQAIAEYVWNGFEANATNVHIAFSANALGAVTEIAVSDDGDGISRDHIDVTFKVAFSSSKPDLSPMASRSHQKNGRGRLTFFTFCQTAEWETRVRDMTGKTLAYKIRIDSDTLDTFAPTTPVETRDPTGTTARFFNVNAKLFAEDLERDLAGMLARTFAWYFETRRDADLTIHINGTPVDMSRVYSDKEDFHLVLEDEGESFGFNCRYVRWKEALKRELSRIYLIDYANGREVHNETSTLNKKGDSFFHSVFVHSPYFDGFKVASGDADPNQGTLLPGERSTASQVYKRLVSKIHDYLYVKRQPVLREYAAHLVEAYEREKVFPEYNSANLWEKFRADILRDTVRSLYEAQPKIFSNLNSDQKKIFVRFLDLITDAGEAARVLPLLEQVVDLDASERERLCRVLNRSNLSSVLKTMEMVQERFRIMENLKRLLFLDVGANEVPHIQAMFQNNLWILGEKYHLLTAAEPDFEQALREFRKHVYGEDEEQQIDHADKNREMDLFMVRREIGAETIRCVVVELKHPSNVNLGKKQFTQICDYMDLVRSDKRFNGSNIEWEFHLIGKSMNDGHIDDRIESCKLHGERHLAQWSKRHKLYVRTWSDVCADFEVRHNFINRNLDIMRESIAADTSMSADELVEDSMSLGEADGEADAPEPEAAAAD